MFWKFDLNATSHVEKLLEKEDVTLQELMDEDDLLQECKAQNRKLVDFLCQQHCMEELVSLITHEPPLDMDEKVRFKYPNTACELLTSDVPQINDKLGGDEALMSILYNFLEHEPPLNPLLASFFSKTIGNLIARKTEQVIVFLRKKDQFIDLVLKHINTSAMMDLLLRLISCVEPAQLRQDVLNWLNEAKIIQRLVGLIHPSQDEDRQSNASQTLCDIIRLSRDQSSQLQEAPEADPLLAALESQECVEQLLKNMFDGERTESCVVSGTQALLTLLEPRRAGMEGLVDSFSQGFQRSYYTVSSSILRGIEPRLSDFHQLLLHPPKAASILTTIGVLEEPLGNARLHGARLIAALLHTNTPSINQELCRLNTMDLLLDLFFKYTWNNFLHFQVELCIATILAHSAHESQPALSGTEKKDRAEGNPASGDSDAPTNGHSENIMVTHLFQKCCLVQRIMDAWETNDRIHCHCKADVCVTRILRVGRDHNDHLVLHLLPRGNSELKHSWTMPIQPLLKDLQSWRVHHLPRQSIFHPHSVLTVRRFFLMLGGISFVLQFEPPPLQSVWESLKQQKTRWLHSVGDIPSDIARWMDVVSCVLQDMPLWVRLPPSSTFC